LVKSIEFILGIFSNTASYLRLWALSLSHMELTDVMYSYILKKAYNTESKYGFVGLISVLILAQITIGLLVVMGTLECMLHSLRL